MSNVKGALSDKERRRAPARIANIAAACLLALAPAAGTATPTTPDGGPSPESVVSLARRAVEAARRHRFREAAETYAAAAARVPPGRDDERLGYLVAEAEALLNLGGEARDDRALRDAIDRFGRLDRLIPRERRPVE